MRFTTSLEAGGIATVEVVASVPFALPVGGKLDAWVDFNFDFDWSDAGEQILAGVVVTNGTNVFQFAVPNGALTGYTFSRFRLSEHGGLPPDGGASGGEVEDHVVTVGPQINSITREDGQLVIRWTGNHALYRAPSPLGPWEKLTGVTSPYPVNPAQAAEAYFGLGPQ